MFDKLIASERARMRLKFICIFIEGVLVLAVLFMFFNMAFGWFARNRVLNASGMQVKPMGYELPTVNAWRFDLTDEDSGEAIDKTGTWVDACYHSDPEEAWDILPLTEQDHNGGTGEKFTFRSIHLGTVDNLLFASEDNTFYVRFNVSDLSAIGATANVACEIGPEDLHFYDLEGTERTSVLTAEQKTAFSQLVTVEWQVSDTAYDMTVAADAAALTALFDNSDTDTLATDGTAAVTSGHTGPYYVYLRFSPHLENCFTATDAISEYMPCQLVFDASVTLVLE